MIYYQDVLLSNSAKRLRPDNSAYEKRKFYLSDTKLQRQKLCTN